MGRRYTHFVGQIIAVLTVAVLLLGVMGLVATPYGELDADWIGAAPAMDPDGELDADWIGAAPAMDPDGELDADW
ncbi:MAG TPA: hypothetical protein ENK60_05905, partial [Anaerolineae bacterium]|nr:hypothetical protein [Anaerolineae bacterium]